MMKNYVCLNASDTRYCTMGFIKVIKSKVHDIRSFIAIILKNFCYLLVFNRKNIITFIFLTNTHFLEQFKSIFHLFRTGGTQKHLLNRFCCKKMMLLRKNSEQEKMLRYDHWRTPAPYISGPENKSDDKFVCFFV